MAGEQRRYIPLYGLDFVRSVGSRQGEERIGDPLKLPPALLQRRDRVLEAEARPGFQQLRRSRPDAPRRRAVEGRAEVLRLDLRERWQLKSPDQGAEAEASLDVWGGCWVIPSI